MDAPTPSLAARPAPSAIAMAPAEPGSRLATLDAARGLALLGILCVNTGFFSLPFGALIMLEPPKDWPAADKIAYFLVHTFAEGKFYPLFSMLFGYGLALQMGRVAATGKSVGRVGARRLLFLILVGFLHATLLWYGDILFVYGIVGLICLMFIRANAKPLLIAGGVLLLVSTLCVGGFGALNALSPAQQQSTAQETPATPATADTPAAPHAEPASNPPPIAVAATPPPEPGSFGASPMGRLFKEWGAQRATQPGDKFWMETETTIYRDGPYSQALLMRSMTWGMFLVVTALTFGWHIIAMFLIGAGLAKLRMLDPANRAWHRRFALAGLSVGAPLCVLATLLPHYAPPAVAAAFAGLIGTFFGPLLSLGYIGGMALLVQSGVGAGIGRWFANTGRMAFTNYLCQTLAMTFIMYHWGLGKFGSFGRAELLGFALCIYAAQTLISNLWLSRFRFGPLEWVWRLWTYGRAERMIRAE